MMNQSAGFNPHISVDCVIFGFDGDQLLVLLIERPENQNDNSDISDTSNASGAIDGLNSADVSGTPQSSEKKHKLPGDLIHLREDLDRAAERVLAELTGLEQIFLRQLAVFGDPGRIPDNEDRQWLEHSSGIKINRVVTTAYYSLIRIEKSNTVNENSHHASWYPVDALPSLIFDHREIILTGLEKLRNEIRFEPLCFELLPGKFTIRQIQTLYEVIFGQPLDNRNFRKKLLKAPYIEPLGEKEKGVAHKPALFYRFNKKKYLATRENLLYYNF